ncbi:MAG: HD-GYP domain-containing protein [Chloroflexota bacterium]
METSPSLVETSDAGALSQMHESQLLAYALDLSRTYRRLKEAQSNLEDMYVSTLAVLAAAIEARDVYLVGHSKAVEAYALGVGKQLGLSAAQLETLRRSALLHDLGKIGVPDATLRKAGPLGRAEWQQIRLHPETGYQILTSLKFLGEALFGVRHHHERYDGKGYPAGLSGQAIPLTARILSLCDALDAMMSNRPYRRGMPEEQALAEIQAQRGRQFDPEIVDALMRAIADFKSSGLWGASLSSRGGQAESIPA